MDEAGLIAAARLGDQDAFAELYRQHARYVTAIGRSILRGRDIEDMCQDTFLLAFTRLHSFDENAQFRSWITRIAINQCLMTLRKGKQASNGESHLVQIDEERAADFGRRDMQLDGVQARLDVKKMLGALNPLQRRVLELAYLKDLPDLEIAELLGTSVTAVKSTIYRAKRNLRDAEKNR